MGFRVIDSSRIHIHTLKKLMVAMYIASVMLIL